MIHMVDNLHSPGLARMDNIFFIAARMVLCFRFVIKSMLVIQLF